LNHGVGGLYEGSGGEVTTIEVSHMQGGGTTAP
jgi:hypothetical protein